MDPCELALAVLRALHTGGVRDVVLSPGSRSAPFALALYGAHVAADLRLHVRLDERSAGFTALGLSIGSHRPVAVVTTSGTAVGNLLPAVMEAHHSGRPLIVVSADRPDRLRGTGANQTTEQAGIFGGFAPCEDLRQGTDPAVVAQAALAACARTGPTQLNIQLDGLLVPTGAPWWPGADPQVEGAIAAPGRRRPTVTTVLGSGPRTVVVAGDDAGPAARLLAEKAQWPLLAEPTSGARAGPAAIRTYRLLLGTHLRAQIE
ncbi:MAG TPA: thiamine pyrophosphate-binding protein, partial [Candidatus Lustribacter sp.]|nr:thiamine pyrophosphate-binding protein [Candidatus Lustribacter sp.]